MEAILSIGEPIVSAIVDKLIGQISSDAMEQFGRESGLQNDLEELKGALAGTRIILDRAERERTNYRNLAQILEQLKDAANDAEDLLDAFQYRDLQQKAEIQKNHGGKFLSFWFTRAINLFNRDGETVREVKGRLESIADNMRRVIRLLDSDDDGKRYKNSARRETSSFLTESQVFGREKEQEKVIELLLKSSDATEPRDDCACSKRPKKDSISVLPVVGIGGIGKTTLAQLICKDLKVNNYFDVKIWIWVSDSFDVKRLTKEMIESVTKKEQCNLMNLDLLQVILEENIRSKRFLLVLDDVWNDDRSKWERFCAPLRSGLQGSKVLVTTRDLKVAEMMGTMDPVLLKGLADRAYWEFFSRQAFDSLNLKEYPKLEAIGRKIARQLKGSPLAAKTLGSLLNSDFDERHWRTIMSSEIWQLKQGEDDIIPVLQLSYQHLPACLKQCFTYCSVFPKGYQFKKDELVDIWMAQGFIIPQQNKRIEEVGSEYFHDLLHRNFFEHIPQDTYAMHDLIYDMLQFVSRNDHLSIADGRPQEISGKLRHLSLYNKNLELSKISDLSSYKNLRTLIFKNLNDGNFGSVLYCLFKVSTKIRVLQLQNCGIQELPENIGNLKHLRCLDVSFTRIRRFPESLCKLYNLLVLNICGCPIENFPAYMTDLVNLRQLKVDEQIIYKLPNIGKLTSLQELPVFIIAKKSGHKIEELKNMTKLHRRLCIKNLESVESKEEASQANLNDKCDLVELVLVWNSNSSISSGNDDEIIEGLQPHFSLPRLEIKCYDGARFPSWLEPQSLKSLEVICLDNIQRWERLPCLGQLPFLKTLRIRNMHKVKQVGQEFYGSSGFPLLEELEIENLPVWEEWFRTEGIQMFPRLRKLCIKNCPGLRGLPCLPPLLGELRLENVGVSTLPEAWDEGDDFNEDNRMARRRRSSSRSSSISVLYIHGCPNLIRLEQWLFLHHLPVIKELIIYECQKVVRLPMERLKDFVSLENLEIIDCPLSISPAQLILPCSLRHLALASCGHLDESLPDCLHNLTSLTSLELVCCPHMTSLPTAVLGHMIALNTLTIWDCEELRSLGDLRALVCLAKLDLGGCPRLTISANKEEQGEGLARLHSLSIDDFALVKVIFSTITQSCLESLRISNSSQLTLFTGEELLWLQNLGSLRTLEIQRCDNLQILPAELHSLSTLRRLEIQDCPEIRSLPERGLPSSLKLLCVRNCRNLESLPTELHRLSTLSYLEISNCPAIRSLPEGLPSSLIDIHVENCHPELTEQWKRHKEILMKSRNVFP